MIDGETGAGKDPISSAIIELQDLVSGNLGKDKDGHRAISPCEAHFLTHQRKMKLLVDIICPKTCNSCLKPEHAEKVLSRLQGSSKCG
uniref:Uncharacterized protein n=1 Tax=Panagrolaimus sp. ES5 TaxID=591445 RepID=A0AC34FJR7_9BILA